MEKFIQAYRMYKSLKAIGSYRLCWIPISNEGNGIYTVIEFFDDEISHIDNKKVEIIL
jgi:hypothetical protein